VQLFVLRNFYSSLFLQKIHHKNFHRLSVSKCTHFSITHISITPLFCQRAMCFFVCVEEYIFLSYYFHFFQKSISVFQNYMNFLYCVRFGRFSFLVRRENRQKNNKKHCFLTNTVQIVLFKYPLIV